MEDLMMTQVLSMSMKYNVEMYPVIVSRHFMIRVNAFLKFIKNNNGLFGGKVKDHWFRIKFQDCGSPHLHMVKWIENHPPIETPEGIRQVPS